MDLNGRIAVVTGAGSGIGREVAVMLVRRGANVALIGRRREALVDTQAHADPSGNQTIVLPRNVACESDVESLFATVKAAWGNVEVLVNNAGVGTRRPVPVGSYETSEYDRIVGTNMRGAFFCARAAVQQMREIDHGVVVNVASIAGERAAPNVLPYNVSKFGLRALSQTLLAENVGRHIKIHTISPGPTQTGIWATKDEPISSEMRSNMLEAEHIAAVAEFLITLPEQVRIDEIVVLPNRFPVQLWDYALLDDA